MGIHYDYKSTKGNKLMEKQAKREKKLAEKKAKRLAKDGSKKDQNKETVLDATKPITLDFLTNPNKEWSQIIKKKDWDWLWKKIWKKEKYFKKREKN